MGKLLSFPGNSQKTPQQERLGAAEAPIIANEVRGGDQPIARIYDLVMRMHVSSAAIQGAQNNYSGSQDTVVVDAANRFQSHSGIGFNQPETGDGYAQKAA